MSQFHLIYTKVKQSGAYNIAAFGRSLRHKVFFGIWIGSGIRNYIFYFVV